MKGLVRVKRLFAVGVAGTMLAIVAGGAWAGAKLTFNRPSAVYPAGDPVRGQALAAQCMACHGGGDIVMGQPAFHPPKLRYQRPSTMVYALQDYRGGQRQSDVMGPIAKTLSDQDMRDLAAYLTAGPNRRRGAAPGGPQQEASAAHQKVDEVCGFCHGESGLGEMEGYPALAGQHQDYLEHALMAYRSGERSNPIMHTFATKLTPAEIKGLAAYFAAQPGLEPVQ